MNQHVQGDEREQSEVNHSGSLLAALQYILLLRGHRASEGALRDKAAVGGADFTVQSVVEVFASYGIRSTFGRLSNKYVSRAMCPFIAFDEDGSALVVDFDQERNEFCALSPQNAQNLFEIGNSLPANFSDYAVLIDTDQASGSITDRKHWFWSAFEGSAGIYVQVILAAVIANFLGLTTSLFVMVVYDRVVPNQAIESLVALSVGVVLAIVFDFVMRMLKAALIDRAAKNVDQIVGREIFERILNLRLEGRQQKAGATSSIVREFDVLREFFTSATIVAVVDLPFIFLFIWVIWLIAGPLAIVPLVAVPFVFLVGLAVQPFLANFARNALSSGMSKQSILVEALNGLETIQVTGSGRLLKRRFDEATDSQSWASIKSRSFSQLAMNSATFVQQMSQVATIFYGVFLIRDGVVTMGALIAAVILGGRALGPLSQLASAMSRANSALVAYRSLSKLMESEEASSVADEARISRIRLEGNIEFRDVTYSFPGAREPVVSNLTLSIPAGQRVALLGRMGSGKSTLLKLASGLISPTAGRVLFDGVDIRQIHRSDFRRSVGVALQDTWLFSGTVRDNIQMGYAEHSDERLLDVANIAGVEDFVSKHPDGYDLHVRERGEGLSGGQRQAVALARALLHDPRVLLLDEPTSALDTASEAALILRLKKYVDGRTVLIVTHRSSILDLVDRVIILEGGKIVADTTPTQLRSRVKE